MANSPYSMLPTNGTIVNNQPQYGDSRDSISGGYNPYDPTQTDPYSNSGVQTASQVNVTGDPSYSTATDPAFTQLSSSVNGALPAATASLNAQQSAQTANLSAYPAMTNSLGLGSQTSSTPAPAPTDAVTNPTIGVNGAIADSSRGFNPWSLVGEANTR